jgi:hypothetical protein
MKHVRASISPSEWFKGVSDETKRQLEQEWSRFVDDMVPVPEQGGADTDATMQ